MKTCLSLLICFLMIDISSIRLDASSRTLVVFSRVDRALQVDSRVLVLEFAFFPEKKIEDDLLDMLVYEGLNLFPGNDALVHQHLVERLVSHSGEFQAIFQPFFGNHVLFQEHRSQPRFAVLCDRVYDVAFLKNDLDLFFFVDDAQESRFPVVAEKLQNAGEKKSFEIAF